MIVTLDWSFSTAATGAARRSRRRSTSRRSARYAPQVLVAAALAAATSRKTGKIPDLTVPNMVATPASPAPTFFGAYGEWMQSPLPTWEDVAWLREQWDGPFMLKGVMRVDDAKRAVDAGVTAISVSNHGGNNLDGTPASIRALPADRRRGRRPDRGRCWTAASGAAATSSRRSPSGAKAVMIGRAYLWGLAANGQAGVENVLDLLRDGLDSAMLGLGRSSVADLSRDDVVIPPGFERHLGDDSVPDAPIEGSRSAAARAPGRPRPAGECRARTEPGEAVSRRSRGRRCRGRHPTSWPGAVVGTMATVVAVVAAVVVTQRRGRGPSSAPVVALVLRSASTGRSRSGRRHRAGRRRRWSAEADAEVSRRASRPSWTWTRRWRGRGW